MTAVVSAQSKRDISALSTLIAKLKRSLSGCLNIVAGGDVVAQGFESRSLVGAGVG